MRRIPKPHPDLELDYVVARHAVDRRRVAAFRRDLGWQAVVIHPNGDRVEVGTFDGDMAAIREALRWIDANPQETQP